MFCPRMEQYLKFFNSVQRGSNFRPVQPLSLFKQCINEVHKNTLKAMCSGSTEAFQELKIVLQSLPEIIQEQIYANLVELSETFFLVDIKPNLSNEWTNKYFCLLIHIITDEYNECEDWRGHLNNLPNDLKTDLLDSLEKHFYKDEKPYYYEEMESWIEKYMHLIEYEVFWAHHEALGLSMYDICGTP